MSEKLTAHFTLAEFLASDTALRKGLSNTPDSLSLYAIRTCTAPGMERVRECLGAPILITSGYRSPAVNKAVGGSSSSQHQSGQAVDFKAPAFGTPLEIARRLVAAREEIRFDQLIQEGAWVHISFVQGAPRGQVLTAHFAGGRVTYSNGLS